MPRRRLEPASGRHKYASRPPLAWPLAGRGGGVPFRGAAAPAAGPSLPPRVRSAAAGPGCSASAPLRRPSSGPLPPPALGAGPVPPALPWLRPALCREGRPCLGAGRRRGGPSRRSRRGPPSASRAWGRAAGPRPRGEPSCEPVPARAACRPPLVLPRRGAAGQGPAVWRECAPARALLWPSAVPRGWGRAVLWGAIGRAAWPLRGQRGLDRKGGRVYYPGRRGTVSQPYVRSVPRGRNDRRKPKAW